MANRLRPLLPLLLAACFLAAGCADEHEPSVFPEILVYDPPNDKGKELVIAFRVPLPEVRSYREYRIERSEQAEGPFRLVKTLKGWKPAREPGAADALPEVRKSGFEYRDAGETLDSPAPERDTPYYYRVVGVREDEEIVSPVVGPVEANAEWWDTGRLTVFLALAVFTALVFWFISLAKRNPDIYVRPIGGLAAMSEAIGRATEMGRPVLYVPGIADMSEIQTITSLVILREVSKETAEYETPIIVPCRDPVVMTAAEEAVRTGCLEAGNPDLFNPDDIRFLSDEQFAFTAATNGIMLREKPATNLFIGAFWAESLILAETGFLAGAIQIAGTANVSQLPFFVAACDYTLIGEEIYAASAYLSREPILMGSLKGSDWAKVIFAALILVGMILATRPRTVLNATEVTVVDDAWAAYEDTEVFAKDLLPADLDGPRKVQLRLTVAGGKVAVDDVDFRQVLEEVPGLASRIKNGAFKKGLRFWRAEGVGNIQDAVWKGPEQGRFVVLPDGGALLSPVFEVSPKERYALSLSLKRLDGNPRLRARLEEADSLSSDYTEFFK